MARPSPIWRKLLRIIIDNIGKAAIEILQKIITQDRHKVDLRKLSEIAQERKVNKKDVLDCIDCEETKAKYTNKKTTAKKPTKK